jgi:hypothetical protein
MKVKNLTEYPMQLGDGRAIGAGSEREYGLPELTERDQRRFQKGQLLATKEIPADAEKSAEKPNGDSGVKTGDVKQNLKEGRK